MLYQTSLKIPIFAALFCVMVVVSIYGQVSTNLAESSARYPHRALSYVTCVHIYYGDFHEVAREYR